MSLNVDGITIPDSQLAREITDLVRDTASPLLFSSFQPRVLPRRPGRQASWTEV